MAKFNIGDIVRLVSGGPVMTVQTVDEFAIIERGPQMYCCQWFSGSKLSHGQFPEPSLEQADAKGAKRELKE